MDIDSVGGVSVAIATPNSSPPTPEKTVEEPQRQISEVAEGSGNILDLYA
jgi:hypothetical protein